MLVSNASWLGLCAATAGLLGSHGLRKRSLSPSGAAAAMLIGFVTMACGMRYFLVLFAFYYSSSRLTKYGAAVKHAVEADFKEGGQRNWVQVCANSLPATLCAAAATLMRGWDGGEVVFDAKFDPAATALLAAFVGYFACCCADTWASELGVLSEQQPRLVTNLKKVRTGTNGGVTPRGLMASAAGGLFIGCTYYLHWLLSHHFMAHSQHQHNYPAHQWRVVPLTTLLGAIGSLTDSILGATLQYSGYCQVRKRVGVDVGKVVNKPGPTVLRESGSDILSNDVVNLLAALFTAVLAAALALVLF
eukprot:jgi/Chlat1/4452/Chrsp29S04401